MKLGYSLAAALTGTSAIAGLVQLALALTPPQVNEIAKKITVRIDGMAPGTGVIVKKEGNTYTVLTNHHVIATSGKYTARTSEGNSYTVKPETIKRLGDIDLAVFQFVSSASYQVAELGNSEQISEGMTVYVAGWASPDRVNPDRGYVFTNGSISRTVAKPKNGYALVYNNVAKPGMSGGAVLNEQGRLVAINGLAVADLNIGATDYLGIPINRYMELAKVPMSPLVNVAARFKKTAVSTPPATILPGIKQNVAYNLGYNFSLARTLSRKSETIHAVAISPDGRTVAAAGGSALTKGDNAIKLWQIDSGELQRTLTGNSGSINAIAISPDGRTLVSGGQEKNIKLWDLNSGKLRRTLTGHSGSINAIAISSDGRTLASGSGDDTIKIWDLNSGKLRRTLTGHSRWISSVAISPNGRTLASGSDDDTIKIWDLNSGKLRNTIATDSFGILCVAISPNGRTLASGGRNKTIEIWNLDTGKRQITLAGHPFGVHSLVISSNGRTLVSGGGDKTVRIWDLGNGKLQQTLMGYPEDTTELPFGAVNSVAISPNGRTLVSANSDNTIGIWSLAER